MKMLEISLSVWELQCGKRMHRQTGKRSSYVDKYYDLISLLTKSLIQETQFLLHPESEYKYKQETSFTTRLSRSLRDYLLVIGSVLKSNSHALLTNTTKAIKGSNLSHISTYFLHYNNVNYSNKIA